MRIEFTSSSTVTGAALLPYQGKTSRRNRSIILFCVCFVIFIFFCFFFVVFIFIFFASTLVVRFISKIFPQRKNNIAGVIKYFPNRDIALPYVAWLFVFLYFSSFSPPVLPHRRHNARLQCSTCAYMLFCVHRTQCIVLREP
jgi:hypothetical protein